MNKFGDAEEWTRRQMACVRRKKPQVYNIRVQARKTKTQRTTKNQVEKKSTIITARLYVGILCTREDSVHLLCAVRVIASSAECKHDGQCGIYFARVRVVFFFHGIFFLLILYNTYVYTFIILFSFFPSFHLYRVRAVSLQDAENWNRRKNIYICTMVNLMSHCVHRVTSAGRGKRVTTLECILEKIRVRHL